MRTHEGNLMEAATLLHRAIFRQKRLSTNKRPFSNFNCYQFSLYIPSMTSKVAIPKSPLGSLSPHVQLRSSNKSSPSRSNGKPSPRSLEPLDSPKTSKSLQSSQKDMSHSGSKSSLSLMRSYSSVGQWNEKINSMYTILISDLILAYW
jgi:hypothetical protein